MIINQPNLLPGAFASDGDKNTIPADNDGLSGLASIAKGFPPITQQPLANGGLPPQRADFNGIFNLFSQFLLFIQNGGVFSYNNTLDYQPPAIVYGNNNFYKCVDENGPNTSAGVQPLTNSTYWQVLTPVTGVSVENNTITVKNQDGDETNFNIDTLNTIPSQSDNSNKIPSTSWVRQLFGEGGYVPFSGGDMTGILNLFTGSTISEPPQSDDNSNKIPSTSWVRTWVQNFVNALSTNLEVETQEDGHFSCPALGITGLMAQNGYISLGKLFGGLILQWGSNSCDSNNYVLFSLPVTFTKIGKIVASDVFNTDNSNTITQSLIGISLTNGLSSAQARGRGIASDGNTVPDSLPTFNWLAIGV